MTKHEYIIMNLQGKLITRCGWSSVIAKRCDSTKKLLYTIFFNSEDPVVKVAIPKDRSITWHVYRYYVLYKVKHITKGSDQRLKFATFDSSWQRLSTWITDCEIYFLEKEKVYVFAPSSLFTHSFFLKSKKKNLLGRRYASR